MANRFLFSAGLVAFSAISLSGVEVSATGFFKVNGSANLTVKPVTLISGSAKDTSYTFSVAGGDSVNFVLPTDNQVSVISKSTSVVNTPEIHLAQNRLTIEAGAAMAKSAVSLSTLSGREVAHYTTDESGRVTAELGEFSRGMYVITARSSAHQFTALVNLSGNVGSVKMADVRGSIRAEIAPASSATYSLSAKSTTPNFGDLNNQTVILIPGKNGTKSFTLPSQTSDAAENFKTLLDSATYDKLFPNRYGYGRAEEEWNPGSVVSSDGLFDFYSYRSLMAAIAAISDVRVEIWNREGGGADYASKIKWFNRKTGKTNEFITNEDYFAEWNLELAEVKTADVDFSKFCAEGDLTTRKRELAAFLANISHETTGMGSEDPDKDWGLYWREEVNWQNGSKELGYIDANSTTYPPFSGKSYHGRGPIQISYNTNYGQVSEFLFGDKNVLLQEPELVITTDSDKDGVEDAMIAFQTGIWFWMYPQAPKPSCHDIMVKNWKPTADDIAKGRDKSLFGMTINVINGGQECGKGDGLDSPKDRIGFYRKYCDFMKIPVPANEYCDCGTMEYIQ